MMFLSQGIDIVEVNRIKDLYERYGLTFLRKVYTEREVDKVMKNCFKKKIQKLSGIFAAKEAVSKAIGYGFSRGIYPKNIEIRYDQFNKPFIYLHDKAEKIFNKKFISKQKKNISISISHEKNYAICIATIIKTNLMRTKICKT